MRELWTTGVSEPQGRVFPDGRLPAGARCRSRRSRSSPPASPTAACASPPSRPTTISAAGGGINDAAVDSPRMSSACARRPPHRAAPCGALALTMIIADETDEAAMAKWEHYMAGTDLEALAWRDGQAGAGREGRRRIRPPAASVRSDRVPTNRLRLIGSYATVARLLDEMRRDRRPAGRHADLRRLRDRASSSSAPRIQPLMKSRANLAMAA